MLNRMHHFRPWTSLIYHQSIRPFHLSATRSIDWADIDEYTNKVNTSIPLSTDVYDKDGKILLLPHDFDLIVCLN